MTSESFISKFEQDFEILESNFCSDVGSFGSLFKVRPNNVAIPDGQKLLEVLAKENPHYDFVSKITTIVKVIPCSPSNIEKAKREAEILSKLDCKNIIKVLNFWIEEPPTDSDFEYEHLGAASSSPPLLLFLQMEYADRNSIRYWMNSPWRNKQDAPKILYEIASGFEYLHGENVIHRDLKPENVVIMTTSTGGHSIVKICDFGLAVILNCDEGYGSERALTSRVGTDGYASPEMAEPGGNYGAAVDIYAFGVMMAEMYVACCSDSEQGAQRLFSSYLMAPGNYPLHPFRFHIQFPQLLSNEEAMLPGLMTSPDPERRPSAQRVREHLSSTNAVSIVPYYDITPEELRIQGTPQEFLSSREVLLISLTKNHIPLQVTKVVLRDVKIGPATIVNFIKPFQNLQHLEILAENFDAEVVVLFQTETDTPNFQDMNWYLAPERNPHPKLQTFIFHQLKYRQNLKNYGILDHFGLKNVMFFLPWPYHNYQLWDNQMIINIKFGEDLVVNINPGKKHFYINGMASARFISVLSYIPFEAVGINHLNSKFRLGGGPSQPREEHSLDGLSKTKLRKLTIMNTSINLFCNGRFFQGFENLVELKYEGELYRVGANTRPEISLVFLPKSLKRLQLAYVKILPPFEWWEDTIKLQYCGFDQCHFPPQMGQFLTKHFQVEHLAFINCDTEHRPNFNLLKTLCEKDGGLRNLERLVMTQFERIYSPDIKDFVEMKISPLFIQHKIAVDHPDLEFRRIDEDSEFPFNIFQLFLNIGHCQIDDIIDPMEVKKIPSITGLSFAPSKAVPGYKLWEEKKEQKEGIDQFYFDGDNENQYKAPKDQAHFPAPRKLENKKVKEIIIKNATISNIAYQFLGCKLLESLVLDNVMWTAATALKTNLPELKIFQYFERLSTSYRLKGWDRLSLGKLEAILFFSKSGFTNLWRKRIYIVISLQSQLNLMLNHEEGEVTIQNMDGADDILNKLGIDDAVKSLVMNKCNVNHSLLPLHLTSLNLMHVEGVQFNHLVSRFPNLKNLYYEAHRDNLQELDMAQIPDNLENVLIGGMSVVKMACVTCKNLTFSNCIFSEEFYKTYPRFLTVEKLLFCEGPTRTPDAREVSALMDEHENLTWVAFLPFETSCVHTFVYNHERREKWRMPIESKEDREFFKRCREWLKSLPGFCDDKETGGVQFVLQRETPEDKWACTMLQTVLERRDNMSISKHEVEINNLIAQVSGMGKLSL